MRLLALTFAIAAAAILAPPSWAQNIDNSQATSMIPFPVMNNFPGTCKPNSWMMRGDLAPGTNVYVCNADGHSWSSINAAISGGTAWGFITGTLSAQTDLANALSAKAPIASPSFTGTALFNGTPLAPSATTDTTNATNITSGRLPHAQLPGLIGADIPNNSANTTGQSATALALSATPSLCPSGQSPLGILPNGNAFGCTAPPGGVASVFGRAGTVVQVTGDYTVSQITGAAPLASPAITGAPTINGNPLAASATSDTTNATNIISGTLNHARLPALLSTDVPNNAANTTGQSGTALALAATPSLCGTGQVPLGILPNGNAFGCNTPAGGVASVFGRTGTVVQVSGDYSVGQITGAAPLVSPSFTGTPLFSGTALAPSATTNALNATNISSGTLPASRLPAQVCAPPGVLQEADSTTTCVQPNVIVNNVSAPPQSGLTPCQALQMCIDLDTTSNAPYVPSEYIELAGSTTWYLESGQSGILRYTTFANLPPPSAYAPNTPINVTDCLTTACNAGGGNVGEQFMNQYISGSSGPTQWNLQIFGQGTSTGAAVQGTTSVAYTNAMAFSQTYPDQIFFVPLANLSGSQTSTITCAIANSGVCIRFRLMLAQDATGSHPFTCPATVHGCFQVGSDPLGINAQSFTWQIDQINSTADNPGQLNLQTTAVSGSVTVGTTVVGNLAANAWSMGWGKKTMMATWCPMCAASTGSSASHMIGLHYFLGSSGILRLGAADVDQLSYVSGQAVQNQSGLFGNLDIQNMAHFVSALPAGWLITWGIGYVGNTNTNAAAEAAYVYSLFGPSGTIAPNRLAAFEIGNEPDGGGSTYGTTGSTSATNFATGWNSFATAIRGSVPSAVFVGPSVGQLLWASTYLTPFFATNASLVGYESQHYYMYGGGVYPATITGLMTPDASLGSLGSTIEGYSAAHSNIPIQVNETGTAANGGTANISNAYVAALWALNYVYAGSIAAFGAGPISFEFINSGGYGSSNTTGYTVIYESSGYTAPHSQYLGMKFGNMAGSGNLVNVSSLSTGGVNLLAYGLVLPSGGGTNVMLINEDASQTSSMTVTMSTSISTAAYTVMTDASLADTAGGGTIQGVGVTSGGAWSGTPLPATSLPVASNSFSVIVPAHSAVMVHTHS